jgi:hypothetical protein
MKILVLDESIWRCGDDAKDPNKSRGTGYTKLLNEEGYMCCLGQFSLQLSPELRKVDIFKILNYLKKQLQSMIINILLFLKK